MTLLFHSLIVIILVIAITYIIMMMVIYNGWKKMPVFNSQVANDIFVAVVIACRNEEKNLPVLICDLTTQDYPKDKFEVILVNDHSTDKTGEIIDNASQSFNNFFGIHLTDNQQGKKEAQKIALARNECDLALMTDADCRVPATWISTHVSYSKENNCLLQLGWVEFTYNNFFGKLQSLELQSLIITAAGSAGAGFPILANGANIAFKKELIPFIIDRNDKQTPSGDDMFLLENVKKIDRGLIGFLKSDKAIVKTQACENFSQFLSQRIRWASKAKIYRDKEIIFSGIFVLATNFFIVFTLFVSIFVPGIVWLPVLLFILKSFPDFILLFASTTFTGKRKLLFYFLPLQVVYPFYVTFVGVFSLFSGYSWKGRSYKKYRKC